MVGIPLTLVLVSAAVERESLNAIVGCGVGEFILLYFLLLSVGLMSPVTWLLGALNSRLGHLYQPFNIRVLHLTIIMSIVLILFFAVRECSVNVLFGLLCFYVFSFEFRYQPPYSHTWRPLGLC